MQRLIPIGSRILPRLFKTFILGFALYNLPQQQIPFIKKWQCFNFKAEDQIDPINNLLSQVVKVCVDGDTLGYAFCIEQNILVTARQLEITQSKKRQEKVRILYQRFQYPGGVLNIGSFRKPYIHQNQSSKIVFYYQQANRKLLPMPSIKPTQRIPITPVQVVQKRTFLSIKDGYIVSKQSGFGIVDGKGEVGGLVIANGRAAGIITSIGRDSERGFMRMVAWGDCGNVLKRIQKLQKDQLYLGISAAALQQRDGLAIARVTPVSPFANKLFMGDIILKVNNQTITHTDDLKRIIMFSGNEIMLTVEREGKLIDVTVGEI